MNLKKYRAYLVLVVLMLVAAGIVYFVGYTKRAETPADGMLVKNMEYSRDGEYV